MLHRLSESRPKLWEMRVGDRIQISNQGGRPEVAKGVITRRKSFLLWAILPASLEALLTECCSSMSSVTLAASLRTSSGRSASFASCKPKESRLLAYVQIFGKILETIVPDVSHHPIHDSARAFNESIFKSAADIPMVEHQAEGGSRRLRTLKRIGNEPRRDKTVSCTRTERCILKRETISPANTLCKGGESVLDHRRLPREGK